MQALSLEGVARAGAVDVGFEFEVLPDVGFGAVAAIAQVKQAWDYLARIGLDLVQFLHPNSGI